MALSVFRRRANRVCLRRLRWLGRGRVAIVRKFRWVVRGLEMLKVRDKLKGNLLKV